MSNIQASADVSTVDEKEFPKYVGLFLADVLRVVNGGIEFGSNISGKAVSAVFTAANTDTVIAHGLGRTPAGYIVTSLSASMVVYNGSVGSNTTNLIIRSSAVGSAGLFVY